MGTHCNRFIIFYSTLSLLKRKEKKPWPALATSCRRKCARPTAMVNWSILLPLTLSQPWRSGPNSVHQSYHIDVTVQSRFADGYVHQNYWSGKNKNESKNKQKTNKKKQTNKKRGEGNKGLHVLLACTRWEVFTRAWQDHVFFHFEVVFVSGVSHSRNDIVHTNHIVSSSSFFCFFVFWPSGICPECPKRHDIPACSILHGLKGSPPPHTHTHTHVRF